jgi:hypothetical protein
MFENPVILCGAKKKNHLWDRQKIHNDFTSSIVGGGGEGLGNISRP